MLKERGRVKPNLVYILADDTGYGDVSRLNPPSKTHTRHLDRMAAAGMIFEDAHATSASVETSRTNTRKWSTS